MVKAEKELDQTRSEYTPVVAVITWLSTGLKSPSAQITLIEAVRSAGKSDLPQLSSVPAEIFRMFAV